MGEKPITEEINVELHLNVKQLTVAAKKRNCERCELDWERDKNCFVVSIGRCGNSYPYNSFSCKEGHCMVLCYWTMEKHNWLVKELIALNDYLYSVNNTLFKTRINFRIYYRDEMKLDPDMFDSVQAYLGV